MGIFLRAETLSDLLGLEAPRHALVRVTSSAKVPQFYCTV